MIHLPLFRWLGLAGIWLMSACRLPAPANDPHLSVFFRPLPQRDTLHVEVSDETDSLAGPDTIPNRLFFNTIPRAMLQGIDYLADSSEAVVLGRYHFPLDNYMEGYWVEIRQFWFQHHSLLLYDKRRKVYTDRITLAEWYGGDGGQLLTGSWMFDFDGDGDQDIIRREIHHSMVPGRDTVLEQTEESAMLLLWENGRFKHAALQDTAEAVRRFRIRTFW